MKWGSGPTSLFRPRHRESIEHSLSPAEQWGLPLLGYTYPQLSSTFGSTKSRLMARRPGMRHLVLLFFYAVGCLAADLIALKTYRLQSALEHRKARHAALRRMAELQESEETFKLRRLECERETWEVERGLEVNYTPSLCIGASSVSQRRTSM